MRPGRSIQIARTGEPRLSIFASSAEQSSRSFFRALVTARHRHSYHQYAQDGAREEQHREREVDVEVSHACSAYSLEVIASRGFCNRWLRFIVILSVALASSRLANAAVEIDAHPEPLDARASQELVARAEKVSHRTVAERHCR